MFKITKPVTPSLRHSKLLKKPLLNKKVLSKSKIKKQKKLSGKNNQGSIVLYCRGGGHRQRHREIDFCRKDLSGIVTSLEYDPKRTAYIASIYSFDTNCYTYIIAPNNLVIGDIIQSGATADPKLGNLLALNDLPLGTYIHNISLTKNSGGQLIRSAGCFAQLIQKYETHARVKLNSGEDKYISLNCHAVIGVVSNLNHNLVSIGKAGRNRWLNKRPKVRGVAMNPVDHPNGGGEGKTSGRKNSISPWGKPSKGTKSRKKIKKSFIS